MGKTSARSRRIRPPGTSSSGYFGVTSKTFSGQKKQPSRVFAASSSACAQSVLPKNISSLVASSDEDTAVMPVSGSLRTSMVCSANSMPASGLKKPAFSMWLSKWMRLDMAALLAFAGGVGGGGSGRRGRSDRAR